MKKILFILLISITAFGQARFPEGVRISGGQPTVTSTSFLTATDATGLQTKIAPVNLPFTNQKTIAQIRAFSGIISSVYTTDLGQEGNWYYDASDTTSADNTGTILVTADGKRIKRIYKYNELNIAWFITNKLAQYYSSGISITSGTNVLNVVGANFNSSYIGSKVRLYSGGAAGAYLLATISSVNSATQVVISVNASSTLTNVQGIIGGFDETASFQNAIDILNANGGKLVIPQGRYYIDGTVYVTPAKMSTQVSIEGENDMVLQDAWAITGQGVTIFKNNAGDVFRINMNAAGTGTITYPDQYVGFSSKNISFVGDDATAGVNAYNIFRSRVNIQNVSGHRIDYVVKQLATDIVGTHPTYCDMSLYKNIRVQQSKLGGLMLRFADNSTLSEIYFEGGDTNSIHMLEIYNTQSIFGYNFLHGVANNEQNTAGSSLILLNQVFGGTFTGIHSESCNFESLFNITNCGGLAINGLETALDRNVAFKLSAIKGLRIDNWYDYSNVVSTDYDIDFGTNNGNRDITWSNVSLFDTSQVAGALRRDMLLNNTSFRGLTYLATPIEYVSDMNSIDGNKQFRSKTGCTNLPSGITNFSGTQYLMADNNNFRVQSGMGGDYMYTRYMNNGVWGSWLKVLNSTDLATLNADISNRIAFDAVSDFNTPSQYKILRGGVSATNAPYSAATYFQGIQFAAANNATFSNQMIFDALGDIFTRTRSSGTWGPYSPVAQFVSQDVTTGISVSARNRSNIYNGLTSSGAINILMLNDVTSIGNVFKIFLNRGSNNLSVQCSPGVTIDGATTTINLPNNGDELWLYATSPNTYVTINKKTAQPLRYKALITQTGTSAPTVTILENTLGTITYGYTGVGVYTANSSALFTANKTFIMLNGAYGNGNVIAAKYNTSSIIDIKSNNGLTPTDGILTSNILIEVYP